MMDPKTLVEAIDKLLKSEEAAILSDAYYEQIQTLRNEASDCCEKGNIEDAKAILREIRQIIEEEPGVNE